MPTPPKDRYEDKLGNVDVNTYFVLGLLEHFKCSGVQGQTHPEGSGPRMQTKKKRKDGRKMSWELEERRQGEGGAYKMGKKKK